MKPKIEIEKVTPAIAEKLLRGNTKNRKLAPSRVEYLAEIMKHGKFMFSNDMVVVSKRGRLLNGQNRLAAVVQSGVSVEMAVAYDVDDACVVAIDRPRRRTTADDLQMLTNIENPRGVAAVCAGLKLLISGDHHSPNLDECRTLMREIGGRNILWAAGLSSKRPYGAAIVRGALAYARAASVRKVEEFASQVIDGIGIERASPAHMLRRHLEGANNQGTKMRSRLGAKVLEAIYAHIHGSELNALRISEQTRTYFARANKVAPKLVAEAA